jgi:curved DNA binding protein
MPCVGALEAVIQACVPGASIAAICALGDANIMSNLENVKVKTKSKGIAFPTAVSVGSAICHLSPLASDPAIVLQDGEMVRIELAAHVDGYIAQLAHTLVLGATRANPVTGRKADVMKAAHTAARAALRYLKPGRTNFDMTQVIQDAARDFECIPVQNMVSYQLLRNVMHGDNQIILNPTETQRKQMETFSFEEGQVFCIDIIVSSGEGKARLRDTRSTIFRMNSEQGQALRVTRLFSVAVYAVTQGHA